MFNLLRIVAPTIAGFGCLMACTVEASTASPDDDAGAAPDAGIDAHDVESDGGEHGACPHATHEFSYEESETTGPEHWDAILDTEGKPKYEACSGMHDGGAIQQSPIEIVRSSLGGGSAPFALNFGAELHWSAAATVSSLWNNGHTWQAGFLGQPMRLYANAGTEFGLRQLHFHAPAEHTIDGIEHPLEVHFVHLAASGNAFGAAPFAAVVGVMFDEDPADADNAELAKIWDRFSKCPQEKEETVDGITLDLNALLPPNLTYVMYDGSLTTPPCSVAVRFHILTTPIRASRKQIEALTQAVGRNDRPHQPLLETTAVSLHPHAQ